jgi:hypothetical protein
MQQPHGHVQNAVATASACGAFEVGTGASGFERLTGSPSDSGAGALSPSGVLRLPSDTAGGRVSCGGMLDEGTLVPRGIGDIGNLSERRPSTSRKCACASSHSARGLVSYMLKFANEEAATYLLALLPHILGVPHQPRQDRISTLGPESRTFCRNCTLRSPRPPLICDSQRALLHPAVP